MACYEILNKNDVKVKQQLLEYVRNVCQQQFGDQFINVKVNMSVPHQAFVQIVMTTVTLESKALAKELAREFSELDQHVDIQVVAE